MPASAELRVESIRGLLGAERRNGGAQAAVLQAHWHRGGGAAGRVPEAGSDSSTPVERRPWSRLARRTWHHGSESIGPPCPLFPCGRGAVCRGRWVPKWDVCRRSTARTRETGLFARRFHLTDWTDRARLSTVAGWSPCSESARRRSSGSFWVEARCRLPRIARSSPAPQRLDRR